MQQNAFRKLTIRQRLWLVGAFFGATLIFATLMAMAGVNADIAFAQRELHGNTYLPRVARVLIEVSHHRTYARRVISGDGKMNETGAQIQKSVEEAFASLSQIDAALSSVLGTNYTELATRNRQSARPLLLKQAWTEIVEKLNSKGFTASVSDELHNQLIGDIRSLYTHIGDQSNLILDPDLDTYYNMDAFLLRFPEIVERLSLLKDLAQDAAKNPTLALADRSRVAEATAMLDFHNRTLNTDIDAVILEAPHFSQLRAELSRELVDRVRTSTEMTAKVVELYRHVFLRNENAVINATEFETQTSGALEAISNFHAESIRQQDAMIGIRVQRLKNNMWRNAGVLLALAFITTLLAVLAVRSITGPVREMAVLARKMSRGNLTETIEAGTSSDELATLARALNDVARHVKVAGLAAMRPEPGGPRRGAPNALHIGRDTADGMTRVTFDGEISEKSHFEEVGELSGSVAFDLSGITRINTHGVREWMTFVGKLPQDLSIIYERCSPVFVVQANMTAGFLKGGKIVSFAAPYFCEVCGIAIEVFLDVKIDFHEPPHKAPERQCGACRSLLRFDDVEETYLAFLSH